MKTKLGIKNFRVFDENGVTIELNPITILTGCNSSGKSSVVKAVFLLNSFLGQIRNDVANKLPIRLDEYKLDFSTYPNNLLGRFDRVVHGDSSTQQVMMEYTVYSLMLSKDVTVQLVFSADDFDELNNAHLDSISFRTEEGVFFSSSRDKAEGKWNKGYSHNYEIIKEACLGFLQIDYLIDCYCGIEGSAFEGKISLEKQKENQNTIVAELKKFDRNRIKDVVNRVYYAKYDFGNIIKKRNADYDVVEWSKEHKSLFMIPVLDRLDGISKNQIWSLVDKEFLKCDSDNIISIASKKIIDAFISSDKESFRDFFLSFEKEFLYRPEPEKDRVPSGLLGKGRTIIDIAPRLGISQEYLFYDPRLTTSAPVLFDSTGELVPSKEKSIGHEEFEKWMNQSVDFNMVYEVVMLWNEWAGYNTSENEKYYNHKVTFVGNTEYSHTMVELFSTFISELLEDLLTPDWCCNMEYVSSSRVNVKRLYPLDVNDDFTKLLKRYFEGIRTRSNEYCWASHVGYETNSFMSKWIKKFEVGDSVSIHIDKEGLGAQIRLHKSPEDEGRLLADEGYGITQLVSILIQIETAILNAKMPRKNNWFGIDAFRAFIDGYEDEKPREATIAVEEPEIHLHPAYQSMLADMIVEAYKMFNIHFIIETHSEYLIRKLQVLVAGKGCEEDLQISNDEISIIYVNSPKAVKENGELQVKKIEILEDGRLDSAFGTGFFDEADNRAMELLRIKAIEK